MVVAIYATSTYIRQRKYKLRPTSYMDSRTTMHMGWCMNGTKQATYALECAKRRRPELIVVAAAIFNSHITHVIAFGE